MLPGDLVVDAGANLGYFTMLSAARVGDGGCVEAFEPLPYLAQALAASVAENRFEARVRVHRAGLDERSGTLALRHAPRTANFGGAHFAPSSQPPPAHRDEAVTTVRLDDVIAGRPCRFIKIDIEGAEPRALRGARETLSASSPIVLCELHDAQLRVVSGVGATELILQMAALGYRCSRLTPEGTRGASLARYAEATPINVVFDPGA